jgi:hypothetical protein
MGVTDCNGDPGEWLARRAIGEASHQHGEGEKCDDSDFALPY